MKRILAVAAFLVLLLLIAQPVHVSHAQEKTETNDSLLLARLDGTWVTTACIDSIITHKAIAPYSNKDPFWRAMILRIENDSVYAEGSLYKSHFPLVQNPDSLGVIDKCWKLFWHRKWKRLCLVQVHSDREDGKMDKRIYTLRKAPEYAKLLPPDTGRKELPIVFWKNYYKLLEQKIFVGTYTFVFPQDRSGQTLVLKKEGKLTGLAPYTEWWFHAYTGTLHPYPGDAITFSEPQGNTNNAPQWKVFNWHFRGDTLVLDQMLTNTGGDSWYLPKSPKTWKLVKKTGK